MGSLCTAFRSQLDSLGLKIIQVTVAAIVIIFSGQWLIVCKLVKRSNKNIVTWFSFLHNQPQKVQHNGMKVPYLFSVFSLYYLLFGGLSG
ncbi:hypothetical protein ACHQM5_030103 [Ranunculus cassubicifolius]